MVALFLIYLILKNEVSTSSMLMGGLCSLLSLVTCVILDRREKESCFFEKAIFVKKFILKFVPVMIKEIVKSSFIIAAKTLSLDVKLTPITQLIPLQVNNESFISILSWSITVTPGTLTLSVDQNSMTITVHSLVGSAENQQIEQILRDMYGAERPNKAIPA